MVTSLRSFAAAKDSVQSRCRAPPWRSLGPPDAETEIVHVEVFALLALGDIAAIEAHAQEAPQARLFAEVVVTVGVDVGFDEPTPGALLVAGLRLFLPALHDAGDGLDRLLPRL